MKNKRPTLQDIATLAGVSKMTVSRYLRNATVVSAHLRVKIRTVLDDLGYIPNRTPDIVSHASSKAIGVLLPSLTNQIFSEVLRGIESVTDAFGYQVIPVHSGYDLNKEESLLSSLFSWNIDGLIITEQRHTDRALNLLQIAHIPIIRLMDCTSISDEPVVGFNNFEAARQMTKTMIAKGHSNIIYMGSCLDERTLIKKNGYEQAMRDVGLSSRSVLSSKHSSYSLGGQLFRQAQYRYHDIDGILCTNDDLAIGTIFECQRQGLRIPRDIGIAGFHGHDIGQALEPELASVLTPRARIGIVGAERLLARIRGENLHDNRVDLGFFISHGKSI